MKQEEIVSQMTLEEKIGLLSGRDIFSTKAVRNIPSIYLSDGPHGVRKQTGASDHLGINKSLQATCFPTAAAMANSWDQALGEKVGECLAEEAGSFQVNVLLGPGLNIKRIPLCGRNFEYFSEDPYLSGKMAAAYIRGIQKKGVAACPKHFAVNSQESLRMVNNSILDERTLREIYLTGFEIAVKEGRPKAIMSSYNRINGIYANENKFLLTDILRKEWGFQGAVITDWGGSNDHVEGVKAGSSLEMPGTLGDSDRQLAEAVTRGILEEKVIDARAAEVLKLVSDTRGKGQAYFSRQEHHSLARRAAAASLVLLKNNDEILPLKPETKVAVVGEFAEVPRYQGAGSSLVNPSKLDTTMELIKEYPLEVLGFAKGYERGKELVEAQAAEAEKLCREAEAVLLYMGLEETGESEGMDRPHMEIPHSQQKLLERLAQTHTPIVVILAAGSAVEMPWEDCCQAIVYSGLGGQAQAGAVLDALIGKSNPSGKLAETWPLSYEDTPARNYFHREKYDSLYKEGLYVGYRYYDTVGVPVRYPFGFGLSYTAFSYNALRVTKEEAFFVLANTGNRDGVEIAQLYVGRPKGSVFGSAKELKGFCRTELKAGESREVSIPFDDKTFRYYDSESGRWEIQKGSYTIMIGASVADIRLQETLEVEGTRVPGAEETAKLRNRLPSYYSGRIQKVSDEEFTALLGHDIVRTEHEKNSLLHMNDAICMMRDAKSGLARLAYQIIKRCKERGEKKEIPDLNILFIYNLPFRGIAKMMNGLVSMEMAEALLILVNGHFIKGLKALAKGYFINRRNRKKES